MHFLAGALTGLIVGVILTVCLEQDSEIVRERIEMWHDWRAQQQVDYAEKLLRKHRPEPSEVD